MSGPRRIVAIAFSVAALGFAIGYFIYAGRPALSQSDSSGRDEITLVCLKCQQESKVTAAEYATLCPDPSALARCPKCGATEAVRASLRCGACRRAIPPQPRDAPFVCPYCKAPLAPR